MSAHVTCIYNMPAFYDIMYISAYYIIMPRGGAAYTASPAMAGPLFKVVRPDIHLAGPLFGRVNWQIQELVHKYKFRTQKRANYISQMALVFVLRSLRS